MSPTFPVLQSNGQTLEPATVMNPRAGAPGDSYHMTVPSRYLELGQIREALQVWRIDDGSKARIPEEISLTSRTGAGEHGASRWPRSRSLQSSLRGSRRRGQHHSASSVLCTRCNGRTPRKDQCHANQQYFIRGPYDPGCVWSLVDKNAVKQGGTNLLCKS